MGMIPIVMPMLTMMWKANMETIPVAINFPNPSSACAIMTAPRKSSPAYSAISRVERKNPSLVGGVGVYSACCGHGPFTHIDVRGYRARWRGTGNG